VAAVVTLNATQLEVGLADVGFTLLRLWANFVCIVAAQFQTAVASTACSSKCYTFRCWSTFCL